MQITNGKKISRLFNHGMLWDVWVLLTRLIYRFDQSFHLASFSLTILLVPYVCWAVCVMSAWSSKSQSVLVHHDCSSF